MNPRKLSIIQRISGKDLGRETDGSNWVMLDRINIMYGSSATENHWVTLLIFFENWQLVLGRKDLYIFHFLKNGLLVKTYFW